MKYKYQPHDLILISDTFEFIRKNCSLGDIAKKYLLDVDPDSVEDDNPKGVQCFSKTCARRNFCLYINQRKKMYICQNCSICNNVGDVISFVSKWKKIPMMESAYFILNECIPHALIPAELKEFFLFQS